MYKDGNNPTDIHIKLHRTRNWVYKWIKRYQTGESDWYLDASKEPKIKHAKIDESLENRIVKIRKKLMAHSTSETRYSYYGAIAIHQELDKAGYTQKPNLSTINRVIKRNGLLQTKVKNRITKESKVYYPALPVSHPGHTYQLDLVTPRYITGYGKVVSVNRIDVFTSQANLNQYESKGADSIIDFIVDDWKEYGLPKYLQLDNEASFRGSLFHPRTFGKLTRFCLNFGVEIIFIPFHEPWRNAHVESFNSRFNERLWLAQKFTDLEHLRKEAQKFKNKHNDYQVYKKKKFSKQILRSHTARYFPENFIYDPLTQLPITKGKVHFIRLVDEAGNINIFNESFYINRDLSFEYVWTTIFTKKQEIKFFHKPTKKSKWRTVKTVEYDIRETVKDNISVKHFC